jgi:hypothetical protein
MTRKNQLVNMLKFTIPLVLCLVANPLVALPVRVLAWDDGVASKRLALIDASGSREIEAMHPSKRTKVYQTSPSKEGMAVEIIGKKTSDGKPCREPLVIPENSKRPLLLVLPNEKAASGIRLHVIEDDEAGFPWGSTRFVNATGRKLVLGCEKKALEIPDSWNPVPFDPGGGERNFEVSLFFRDRPEKPFYSAVWQHDKSVRTLVFLVPGTDPRLGPVAMKMIPEDRKVIEAASRAADP